MAVTILMRQIHWEEVAEGAYLNRVDAERVEAYLVTGKRRAPKGNRVYLEHPNGTEYVAIANGDGFLPGCWSW